MNYLIFIIIVLLLLYPYHLYRWAKSNYVKFEEYLCEETCESICILMHLVQLLIKLAMVIVFVYLGGELISYLGCLK